MNLPKHIKFRTYIATIIILTILFSATISYVLSQSNGAFTISEGMYPGAPSYTIWKEGSTYYAKDAYGAITSGTNATAVIQAAIDALPSSGGHILIKAGNYTITGTDISGLITLKSHVTLSGEGSGGQGGVGGYGITMLQLGSDANLIRIPQGSVWVTIENMLLDGDWNNRASGNGIRIETQSASILIRDVHLRGFPGWAIITYPQVSTTNVHVWIERVLARAKTGIINLWGAHSTTYVKDSSIGNAVESGDPYSTSYALVFRYARNVIVENVGVFGSYAGLSIEDSEWVRVSKVYAHVNTLHGIWLVDSNYTVIESSLSYGNGQGGDTSASGIRIVGSSSYNQIVNCYALSNLGWFGSPYNDNQQYYGFYEGGTADYNTIIGGTFLNALTSNLVTSGANSHVSQTWNGTTWIS